MMERVEIRTNARARRDAIAGAGWSRATRRGGSLIALTVAIVVVLMWSNLTAGSILASTLTDSGVRSTPVESSDSTDSSSVSAYGAAQLAAASSSLQNGAGPTGAASPKAATTSPSWSEVSHPAPTAVDAASIVYDAADGYVLLFGGANSALTNGTTDATWEFSNGVWTQLHPTTSPSSRAAAAMAYDAKDHYVVLFGGYSLTAGILGDTWKFVGGQWTKLAPSTHPGALLAASMSYDAKDGYVVLFGGDNKSSTAQSVTWTFSGGDWTKLAASVHPSARYGAMMDYDAGDGYVLLFGGWNGSAYFDDTWTFLAGSWTKLAPSTHPGARANAGMAYSAIDQVVVLFGGQVKSGVVSDTWEFAAGAWTQISSAAHPSKRSFAQAADGTASTDLLVFGGSSAAGVSLNDTWTFQGGAWNPVLVRLPVARDAPMMAYDQKDGYVLMFGGESAVAPFGVLGDTWAFSNGIWTPLYPTVSPPARWLGSMAYDAADGYVVLFGGMNQSGANLGDTWTFTGGVWSNVTSTSVGPSARNSAAMTYDYADGYVLLYGGTTPANTYLNDSWTFSAGVWSNVTGTVNPGPLTSAAITYDSEDGYVLLFGGRYAFLGQAFSAETWSYLGGQWTDLTSSLSASPPASSYAGLVDDTYDGYPLLFGGAILHALSSSTWEFTGSGWTELHPAEHPSAQQQFGMAYDPPANCAVVLANSYAQTWTY